MTTDLLQRIRAKKKLEVFLKTINGTIGEFWYNEEEMIELATSQNLSGSVYKIEVDYKPTSYILGHIRTVETAVKNAGGNLLEVTHWDPVDRMGEWDEDGDTRINYYVVLQYY